MTPADRDLPLAVLRALPAGLAALVEATGAEQRDVMRALSLLLDNDMIGIEGHTFVRTELGEEVAA